MKLVSDNLCKLLAERHPQAFASWLLNEPFAKLRSVKVLKTELSSEPVRADSLIWLRLPREILHLEFTVRWPQRPPLEIRMLDYWVRGYRLYRVPIRQFVLVLLPSRRPMPEELHVGDTWHRYRVVKVYEQDPELFLQSPALLPLAPLAKASRPVELLERTVERIELIKSPAERREVEICTHLLAGLRFDKRILKSLFQEAVMRESVTYQEILQKGEVKGRLEGRLEGLHEGRLEQAQTLLQILIGSRFGQVNETVSAMLKRLSVAQTEELVKAQVNFQRPADLTRWLKKHAANGG